MSHGSHGLFGLGRGVGTALKTFKNNRRQGRLTQASITARIIVTLGRSSTPMGRSAELNHANDGDHGRADQVENKPGTRHVLDAYLAAAENDGIGRSRDR